MFEWGLDGLRASPADVTVIADAGDTARGEELHALALADASRRVVLCADQDNAGSIASACLAAQAELGERASIAIIGVGDEWPSGALRPSAADELVAGAVVDSLCDAGIDFHSPACAVASAAYVSLRRAVRHLASAERSSRGASG